jgi:hypothetical protein
LLVQEKVTKENTPSRPRSPGSCPATSRGRCGGSLTAHPCADSERARIVRAPLRAFSSRPRRGREGTREEQSAAFLAAEATFNEAVSQRALTLTLSRERERGTICCVALAFDVEPVWGGEGRTDQARAPARVSARDRAHSAAGQGCPVSGTPAARSEPARSAGAPPGYPFSGLLLFGQAKRSDPAARMADGKTQGRESVFATAPKIKNKSKWIPAYAG